jgi:hypothetical protein
MRALFWIFVVANVILFVAMQWGSWPGNSRVVTTLPPLNVERIQIVGSAKNAVGAVEARLACMEWGYFFGDEFQRVSDAVAALNLGGGVGQRETEHSIGYWLLDIYATS